MSDRTAFFLLGITSPIWIVVLVVLACLWLALRPFLPSWLQKENKGA